MQTLRGPDVLKRTAGMYRAAFPDLRIAVDEIIVAGDKVVLRWHSEGTHRGELAGLAPTGARGSVTGISIDQWKDGKLVETWNEWDNLGLARQVGAAPPEGSVGEKVGALLQRLDEVDPAQLAMETNGILGDLPRSVSSPVGFA
jgi:predicted ester cyclase